MPMFLRMFLLTALLALTTASAPAKPTLAVSYFDNNSGDPGLDALAKGLSDMLITDLSGLPALQVVERAKLNQVLSELKLSRSKFIDPKTAVKLGRGLAARYVLTGGYVVSGQDMRVDVRVVEVESGKVLSAERVQGKRDDFFALEKELVDVLVGALSVKLSRDDRARLRRNATQSYEAWSQYAAGLDASDRGDAERAREAFAAALAADPAYAAAKTAIERLGAMFAKNDRDTASYADAEFRALDPKAPDFAQKVTALLSRLDWEKTDQSVRKTKLLLWLGKQRLLACTRTRGPAPESTGVINNGVPQGGVISHCLHAQEVLYVSYQLMSDPWLWPVVPRVCEYFIRQLPEDKAVVAWCEKIALPEIQSYRSGAQEREVHDAPNMKAMLSSYADQAPK